MLVQNFIKPLFVLVVFLAASFLVACNLPVPTQAPVITPGVPSPTALAFSTPTLQQPSPTALVSTPTSPPEVETPAVQTPTSPPEPTALPPQASPTLPPEPTQAVNQEAILIVEPGSGSRITSPARIHGFADPTFEGTLGVRILTADGTQLAQTSTQIQADVGQRGPFQVEVPFQISQEQQGFIQVYATSARDGRLTHLASSGVTLAVEGEQRFIANQDPTERIRILQPQPGTTASGGSLHVEGIGLASFEQSLLIELLDANGNTIATQPVTVQAPDLGQPGPFSADLAYPASVSGPARLLVRDISPAFGGDTHVSSVEINLAP